MASVQLHVSTLQGATTTVLAESAWTVARVKEQLCSEMAIEVLAQQLLLGGRLLRDDERLQALVSDEDQQGDSGLHLSLVLRCVLRPEDLDLSQYEKSDDYIVAVMHLPSGQVLEHKYSSYHPLAGPVRPAPVTKLSVTQQDDRCIVEWEWSRNSFDVADPGALFQRPLLLEVDGTLRWAGSCTSTPNQPPPKSRPAPPEVLLAADEELCVQDVVISDQGDIVVQHKSSCSEVRHGLCEDGRSFFELELTQAGGYVRAQFRERCKYNRDVWVSDHCRFLKLAEGRLSWAK